MTLNQIEAALSDALPSDCDAIYVTMMQEGRFGRFYTVSLHYTAPDGLRGCAIKDGPTLAAAYDAALKHKTKLLADARASMALVREREGVN